MCILHANGSQPQTIIHQFPTQKALGTQKVAYSSTPQLDRTRESSTAEEAPIVAVEEDDDSRAGTTQT
jgi:hypothetical protein